MTATAHALVGGAIAASVQNPLLGITLATLSHPLLDMVPHWDAGIGWREKSKKRLFLEGFTDLTLGVILAYFLFGQNVNPIYFFACIFMSESWDLAEIPYWFFNWRFAPFSWIYKFQSKIQGRAMLPWGIVTQVFTIAVIVGVLNNVTVILH